MFVQARPQRCQNPSFTATHSGGNGNRSIKSGDNAESDFSGSTNSADAESDSISLSVAKSQSGAESNSRSEPLSQPDAESNAIR
jgi:hypothetical protein